MAVTERHVCVATGTCKFETQRQSMKSHMRTAENAEL